MANINQDLIDAVLLLVTIIICLFYNKALCRHPLFALKKGFTYILIFMAMYPLLNMVVHLIAVGVFSYLRVEAGVFKYDLRFYTLIQFGVLLVLLNAYLLGLIRQISRGNWPVYGRIMIASTLQIAIMLPLLPFNPISLLPVICSIVLMVSLAVARRGRQQFAPNAAVQQVSKTVPGLVGQIPLA